MSPWLPPPDLTSLGPTCPDLMWSISAATVFERPSPHPVSRAPSRQLSAAHPCYGNKTNLESGRRRHVERVLLVMTGLAMQCGGSMLEISTRQYPSSVSPPLCGDSKFTKQSSIEVRKKNAANSKSRIWRPCTQTTSSGRTKVVRCSGDLFPTKEADLRTSSRDSMQAEPIRTLLLDNYDSYTYNLHQLVAVINGVAPLVLRNDEITWDDLYHLLYKERAFHNVIISPGPGSPTCPSDIGICMKLLQQCHDIPILGVCLGHQALGCVHGAKILRAPEPVHGRLSEVEHIGNPLFANIPSGMNSGFKVVRYHSLIVDGKTLPEDLVPTAWTVAESGFVALDDWQDSLDMSPNTTFASEGELPRQGRDGAKFRRDVTGIGQFHYEVKSGNHNTLNRSILMGISHRTWPHHGVQFHPESVATTYGRQILENFRNITEKFWVDQPWQPKAVVSNRGGFRGPRTTGLYTVMREDQPGSVPLFLVDPSIHRNGNGGYYPNQDDNSHSTTKKTNVVEEKLCKPMIAPGDPLSKSEELRLHWQKLSGFAARAGGSRVLFCKLFGDESVEDTFWLDSSSLEQGRARFSFMGGRGGCLWQHITYRIVHDKESDSHCGVLKVRNAAGHVKETVVKEGFLDLLNRELELRSCRSEDYASLPFDFCGGFIGYLGYELKIECGAESNQHRSPIPDAGMFLVDRVVAVDHSNDDVYILALFQDGIMLPSPENTKNYPEGCVAYDGGFSSSCQETLRISAVDETEARFPTVPSLFVLNDGFQERLPGEGRCAKRVAEAWVEDIVRKVHSLAQQGLHEAPDRMHVVSLASSVQITKENVHPPFIAEKPRARYIKDVKRCQELIKDGESYEVCLTTQLRRKFSLVDCFGLYLTLRETNPAQYSAWLHFGKDGPCICSSSPERFLRLDRQGILEAKPIKGTVARGNTPVEDERLKHELQNSIKDQAENLMIVDLLRNDLGRVCEPGTVHVPSLMAVESYSTVHTLVSTVKGKKRKDVTPINCVRAAFPGGSMTGAPKLRTMEIIDSIESSPRGVYSGTIGYFSFNSSFDLNIVIRTLVIHEGESSLGAGGAVIALSDPEAEYEEMLLKTKAPIRAVSKFESHLKRSDISDEGGLCYHRD